MNSTLPPRLAIGLLKRFASGEKGESLIGDLVEQFHGGRSDVWFWRQTVVAIVVAAAGDIREHKLRAVLQVAVGFGILVLCEHIVTQQLSRGLYFAGSIWLGGRMLKPSDLIVPVWWTSMPLEGVVAAWIVGHLHRVRRVAMVGLFAACFALWQPTQLFLWRAFDELPNGFLLPRYTLASFMVFIGILAGGLCWGDAERVASSRANVQGNDSA